MLGPQPERLWPRQSHVVKAHPQREAVGPGALGKIRGQGRGPHDGIRVLTQGPRRAPSSLRPREDAARSRLLRQSGAWTRDPAAETQVPTQCCFV